MCAFGRPIGSKFGKSRAQAKVKFMMSAATTELLQLVPFVFFVAHLISMAMFASPGSKLFLRICDSLSGMMIIKWLLKQSAYTYSMC